MDAVALMTEPLERGARPGAWLAMLSEAQHEVVIRFSESTHARPFLLARIPERTAFLFLLLGCWMGYRAVVEWVKDSPDRAMGVVPDTLHVRVAVGSQPDALGPESSGSRLGRHEREDPNLPRTTAAGEGDEAHPRQIERPEARKMSLAGKLDQSDHGGIRCR